MRIQSQIEGKEETGVRNGESGVPKNKGNLKKGDSVQRDSNLIVCFLTNIILTV